jgi:hypothetical protein
MDDETTTNIVSTKEEMEILPAITESTKITGRGGKRPGAGRPPSGRSQNIKYHFYQLLDNEAEAKDIFNAWNILKEVAISKALNNNDTEDLKWYLNRFIPQARDGAEINIDTTGEQPIITIVYSDKDGN